MQIGTKDDEEKPRFAGLRPGQKMDAINLADAMELFKLPRTLGETQDGESIVANVGRFGPYVKYGSKYASLKEDDPYTVTLERAQEVIRLKKEADAARLIQDFPEHGIQVLNGRYGPYIPDKKKNAKIPKDRDPRSRSCCQECQALLAAAPERGTGGASAVSVNAPPRHPRQPLAPTVQRRPPLPKATGARKKALKAAAAPATPPAAARSNGHAPPAEGAAHARPKSSARGARRGSAKSAAAAKAPPSKARAKSTGSAPGRSRLK